MKHWKKTPEGEKTDNVNAEPPIPGPEEIERRRREGGGGGQGVEIDPHWVNLRLPDHPRGEGWIEKDPSKPVWPED